MSLWHQATARVAVRWARVYRTANLYMPPAQPRGPAAYRETNTSFVIRLGRLRVLEALSNPGLGRRNRRVVVVVVSFTPPYLYRSGDY